MMHRHDSFDLRTACTTVTNRITLGPDWDTAEDRRIVYGYAYEAAAEIDHNSFDAIALTDAVWYYLTINGFHPENR